MEKEKSTDIFYYGKVKAYSDGIYKLFYYKEKRIKSSFLSFQSGSECNAYFDPESIENLEEFLAEKQKENRERHLYEVKTKLRDYARNNDFDHFWTLTFDPKICGKDNSYRFSEMKKWLDLERRKAKRRNLEFRYIFLPEYHNGKGENNGTVHWHGLTGGYIPELVNSGKKFKGICVYNCISWEYGFSNVQKVRSKIKVANYITKYITKDLVNSPVRKGKKKYWSSKNLQLPQTKFVNKKIDLSSLDDFEKFDCDVCKIFEFTEDIANKLDLT